MLEIFRGRGENVNIVKKHSKILITKNIFWPNMKMRETFIAASLSGVLELRKLSKFINSMYIIEFDVNSLSKISNFWDNPVYGRTLNSCLTSEDSSRNMTIYGHEEFKRRRVLNSHTWRAVLVQPAGFVYLYTITATYIQTYFT